MDTLNLPTKRNLLLTKQRLALAQKGHDILDKKLQAMVQELAKAQKLARPLWEELCAALSAAHTALNAAQAEMGYERVQSISRRILQARPNEAAIPYSLAETTVAFDAAVHAWKTARELIVSWAALDNTIYRLRLGIKKTQKRANALGNITIPKYVARIKYIQERLEERERDELARLKLIKERRL